MNNKTSLIWTKVLMAFSLVLLLCFVLYWLQTQYMDEQQMLQEELANDLANTQRDVTDSLIYKKYVAPIVLGKNKDSAALMHQLNNSNSPLSKSTITVYNSAHGSHSLDSLAKAIDKEIKLPGKIKTKITFNKDDGKIIEERVFVTSSDDGSETNNPFPGATSLPESSNESDSNIVQIITSTLRTVLKSFKDSVGVMAMHTPFNDTLLVRNEFEKELSARSRSLHAAWFQKSDSLESNKNPYLLIHYNSYSDSRIVGIDGYQWYLAKKILPQTLFVIFLLLMTFLAFIFTYRNIKKQIRLNEMKNSLISNMSHELKTPVATVKVALEALADFGVVNNPRQALEYIQMAKLETVRLEMLVNKALNTSLMEQGKITLQKETTNISALAEEIVGSLKLRMQQNDATISLHTEGNDFDINIDKLHVQGALLNIIDNSLKYGNAPVKIDISITALDASITIDIQDNGPGIPEEYETQVFEKFFRVPKGDQHNVHGYGLGLSYVQQVMQLHGGMVQLRNVPGDGCRFSLQFFRGR